MFTVFLSALASQVAASPSNEPVAPESLTLAMCARAFKGDRAAQAKIARSSEEQRRYLRQINSSYAERSNAHLQQLADRARWTEADSKKFLDGILQEAAYLALQQEQRSIADKLELTLAKAKTVKPAQVCEITLDIAKLEALGNANVKSQYDYVDKAILSESERLNMSTKQ